MTHQEIYYKFCKWSPIHANMVKEWKPWGSSSICVWLTNGMMYKVKHYMGGAFIMQTLSDEDIRKKYGSCQ